MVCGSWRRGARACGGGSSSHLSHSRARLAALAGVVEARGVHATGLAQGNGGALDLVSDAFDAAAPRLMPCSPGGARGSRAWRRSVTSALACWPTAQAVRCPSRWRSDSRATLTPAEGRWLAWRPEGPGQRGEPRPLRPHGREPPPARRRQVGRIWRRRWLCGRNQPCPPLIAGTAGSHPEQAV
jgi:hypothetical protein